MDKKLMKYCGSLQQMVYARPIVYKEGRAEHMNAIEAKCGDIFFHSAADKALDITDFSYKGMNMTFLAKPGLEGRNQYDTNGEEALRSIMGGLFFTCGLENICAPCTVDGKDYPMHGRMRTTPAEHVCTDVITEGETCKLVISGEMREAELFGENMVLRRRIESVLGENSITVTDEIENQAFRPEPLMLQTRALARRIPEQGQRPTAGQIPAPAAGPQDLTPEKEPPAPAPTGPPIRVRAQAGLRTAARLTQAEERPIRALETARPPAPEMEAAMLPQKRLRMTALSS